MALKIMDESRLTTATNSIRALEYAIKHGAKISSNSYGGHGVTLCEPYLNELENVLSNAPDHLFVAAAGNEANNNDDVPACPCNANLRGGVKAHEIRALILPSFHLNYFIIENLVKVCSTFIMISSLILFYSKKT